MEKLENWANRTRETSKFCTSVEITAGTSASWGMIIWKAGWQRAQTVKVILTMPSTTLVLSSLSQHKPQNNELMYWSRSKENILMVIFVLDPALYLSTQKNNRRGRSLIDKWNKKAAGGIRNLCCIWVTVIIAWMCMPIVTESVIFYTNHNMNLSFAQNSWQWFLL